MKRYDGVLKRVRELEWKYGIAYPRPNEKPYKIMRFFYVIFFLWTNIMNVMHIGSIWIKSTESESIMTDFGDATYFIGACTITLIIAYVLRLLNNVYCHIGSFVLTLASGIGLLLTYAPWFEDLTGLFGYKIDFYWRHIAPIVLMVILLGILVYIYVNSEIKTERTYNKVIEALYDKYGTDSEGVAKLTDGQWEEFIENYDPRVEKENRKKKKKEDYDEQF